MSQPTTATTVWAVNTVLVALRDLFLKRLKTFRLLFQEPGRELARGTVVRAQNIGRRENQHPNTAPQAPHATSREEGRGVTVHSPAAPRKHRPLRDSYYSLKKKAAPGVDGMTWEEYGAEDLEGRLAGLRGRMHRGGYRAKPPWRAYILKTDGRHDRWGSRRWKTKSPSTP